MDQINSAQFTAALRGILLSLCGGLVTNGYMTDAELQMAAGFVAGAVVLGYGIYKRRTNGLIATTAKLPQVQAIVAPAVASKLPDNVVSSATQVARVPGVNP